MNRDEFLLALLDVLERDEELTPDMELADIDEWDSLSVMATMAFLDKNFSVKTTISDYKNMKTIEDIMIKVGI